MGRFVAAVLLLLAIGIGYAASPFVAAWTLREAIKNGDVATIERKVVWDGVRASLRASIASNATLLPEATAAGERIRPTMWQRVKTAFGQSMLDRFVESYVTPEGLPKLFRYQKTLKETARRGADDEDNRAWLDRAKAFYRRLARAEFKSPTRMEIEIVDRFTPDRRYVSIMELHGFEWKLAELHVRGGLLKSGQSRTAREATGTP